MKFINKKNTTKELSEGMSNIVYHFTYFSRLYNILKENKFHASPNIGSTSDLNISKGKFYFFSTTRSGGKPGYKTYDTKLVLDGRKLNQRYKGFPVDYWKYSTNPADWDGGAAYKQALQSNELEDRIILDAPVIPNAIKYILEIHILISRRSHIKKNILVETINKANQHDIPIYFYDNENYYFSGAKNKTVDPYQVLNLPDGDEEETHESDILMYLDRIMVLLSYNDKNNYNKILDYFGWVNDEKRIKWFDEKIKEDEYNYFKYRSSFSMQEYNAVISADVHNIRSNPDDSVRFIIKMLTDDMKKNKITNLKDYISYKLSSR